MGKIFVTADLHIGNESIITHRGFKSSSEYHSTLIKKWNETVSDDDTVYILGDIGEDILIATENVIKALNGHKYWVLGNHDTHKLVDRVGYLFDGISATESVKIGREYVVLTHIPIHESMLFHFKYNVHGHVHEDTIKHPRYVNVSIENAGMAPVLLGRDTLKELQKNYVWQLSVIDTESDILWHQAIFEKYPTCLGFHNELIDYVEGGYTPTSIRNKILSPDTISRETTITTDCGRLEFKLEKVWMC